ncbi:hypothetical protein [Chamaesiphon sp. OTE_8_metabat_110]|nr:hypothetical protein [Chamaesiphon sp. OTE_8_metabat_110]
MFDTIGATLPSKQDRQQSIVRNASAKPKIFIVRSTAVAMPLEWG